MYSFNHEKLRKLVDYITVMPPEGASHARGHKYLIFSNLNRFPFIASEIFNCEINSILDKLFELPPVSKVEEKEEEPKAEEQTESKETEETSKKEEEESDK